MALSPSNSGYSADELEELLVVGATIADRPTLQAAVHLLTFTELPHRSGFAELLDIEHVDGPDGAALAAFVRDWKSLYTAAVASRRGGADQRMLALAVSLAAGEPVNLAANVSVGGHAHARRVIEAFAIATGAGELFGITPTPALKAMLAARDALLA